MGLMVVLVVVDQVQQWSSGGTGNTPPVSPPQGNNGGSGNFDGPVMVLEVVVELLGTQVVLVANPHLPVVLAGAGAVQQVLQDQQCKSWWWRWSR